jgi:hypothetical protein
MEHIQVEVSVDRNSIQLVPVEGQVKQYTLEFTFTAITDCVVTVYQFAQEIIDEHRVSLRFEVDTTMYPAPQSFPFSAGEKQVFHASSLQFDFNLWSEDLLMTSDRSLYPLVISIVRPP